MNISDFHFIRPLWLIGLPVGAVIAWMLWHRLSQRSGWQKVCDPELLSHLLVNAEGTRHNLPYIFFAAVWTIAIFALAGPTWKQIEQPVFNVHLARVLVLDASSSMRVGDLKPSRLGRAKFKITDLLDRYREGQTGLVIFAGDAFVISPLTDDTNTLKNFLPALETNIMPVQGNRADLGLQRAAKLLAQAGFKGGELILISDGVDGIDAEESARDLYQQGYTTSVLAVGTQVGAPIPAGKDGFVKDAAGNIVLSRLQPGPLQKIAESGGGRFAMVSADAGDLDILHRGLGSGLNKEAEGSKRTSQQWRDEGPWLVLLLLPLAAFAFRRGWILAILLYLGSAQEPVLAFSWEDLWQRSDQQAAQAMQEGDHQRALTVTRNPGWRGSALYRNDDFPNAEKIFAEDKSPSANYNRGNALARQGKLQQAIEAYEKALERQADYPDAEHNLEVVKSALQQQKQQQQQSGQNGGQRSPEPQESNQQKSQGQSSDSDASPSQPSQSQHSEQENQGANGSRSNQPNQGEQSVPQQSASSAEEQEQQKQNQQATPQPAKRESESSKKSEQQKQLAVNDKSANQVDSEVQQSVEQWLRRIPDDPGGLLRRKLQREYYRRLNQAQQGSVSQ